MLKSAAEALNRCTPVQGAQVSYSPAPVDATQAQPSTAGVPLAQLGQAMQGRGASVVTLDPGLAMAASSMGAGSQAGALPAQDTLLTTSVNYAPVGDPLAASAPGSSSQTGALPVQETLLTMPVHAPFINPFHPIPSELSFQEPKLEPGRVVRHG